MYACTVQTHFSVHEDPHLLPISNADLTPIGYILVYVCTSTWGLGTWVECLPKLNSRHGILWVEPVATTNLMDYPYSHIKGNSYWRHVKPTCLRYALYSSMSIEPLITILILCIDLTFVIFVIVIVAVIIFYCSTPLISISSWSCPWTIGEQEVERHKKSQNQCEMQAVSPCNCQIWAWANSIICRTEQTC